MLAGRAQTLALTFLSFTLFFSREHIVYSCLGEKCIYMIYVIGSDPCVKVQASKMSSFVIFSFNDHHPSCVAAI